MRYSDEILEFLSICGKYLIDPNIAYENEKVKKYLNKGDLIKITKILEEEF
tara:strand:+ start:1547 stop:1699 length:153 start_codon:yes stop_codon:yes gene_type:complete